MTQKTTVDISPWDEQYDDDAVNEAYYAWIEEIENQFWGTEQLDARNDYDEDYE